jgi:hypothetical protein
VADLEAPGLLETVKPITSSWSRAATAPAPSSSPLLTDQWYVAMTRPGPSAKTGHPDAARNAAADQAR